jgi:hypothetical protein
MTTHKYIFYGTHTKADELVEFVEHLLEANLEAEARKQPKTPICVWGMHGIGKTQIIEQITTRRGWRYAYIAPAQFEEMGDLLGMPAIEGSRTVFRPPAWVPTEEGPGILLIDDANRADDRILRGIMQLLQNYELVSWRLPPRWQIILTANPDGGDYSVTPMDNAMLTRLMHVTLSFDVKAWARWAESAGVDQRGINFVLTYPEMVTGQRTTPRTMVQFFESIRRISDLKANLGLVRILADACLDESTATAFLTFIHQGFTQLITPEQICNAKDFTKEIEGPIKSVVVEKTLRVDILATLCTRLINHLTRENNKLGKKEIENTKAFLLMDFLPKDLRLSMARDLVNAKNPMLKTIMADPNIAKLVVQTKTKS